MHVYLQLQHRITEIQSVAKGLISSKFKWQKWILPYSSRQFHLLPFCLIYHVPATQSSENPWDTLTYVPAQGLGPWYSWEGFCLSSSPGNYSFFSSFSFQIKWYFLQGHLHCPAPMGIMPPSLCFIHRPILICENVFYLCFYLFDVRLYWKIIGFEGGDPACCAYSDGTGA